MPPKLKTRPAETLHEVHVFLGTAVRKDDADLQWAPGKRYSLLIFSRQPEGEAPDEPLARKSASAAGWTGIKLERSKRLPVTAVPESEALRAAFREALSDGASVVAHGQPVK
jgi:hypothetical protein